MYLPYIIVIIFCLIIMLIQLRSIIKKEKKIKKLNAELMIYRLEKMKGEVDKMMKNLDLDIAKAFDEEIKSVEKPKKAVTKTKAKNHVRKTR